VGRFGKVIGSVTCVLIFTAFPFASAPWFFFVTFKMIAPFMDPITRAKIKFVYDTVDGKQENTKATTNEWVHLHDFISSDQLETDFGGNYPYKYDLETYWKQLLTYTGNPYKVIDY
jgi:hypothetical protein